MASIILNGFTVATYSTLAAFPAYASDGSVAVDLATDSLYEFDGNTSSWVLIGPATGAGTGTVTSVDLAVPSRQSVSGNPITVSGTITVSDNDQPANQVFAGPISGGDAAPAFRALVAADLPSLPTYTVNEFVLSPTDITNKYVTLAYSPVNPTLTVLNIIGGIVQEYTTDFTVTGSTLSWSGLFLDGVLVSGDTLIVQFY